MSDFASRVAGEVARIVQRLVNGEIGIGEPPLGPGQKHGLTEDGTRFTVISDDSASDTSTDQRADQRTISG